MTNEGDAMPIAEAQWEDVSACPFCSGDSLARWRDRCVDSTGLPGALNYHRCRDCDCRVLTPRVEQSAIGRYYRHGYAPYSVTRGSAPQNFLGQRGSGALQSRLARTYSQEPNERKRVLDFGCGSASFLDVARQAGWETVASDFSPHGLRGPRESGHECHLVDESFWSWLSQQRFDVIRLSHVLEHLYDPARQFDALIRSLNPSGTIHIVTPDPRGPACLLARRNSNFFQLVHVTLIPPASLIALARSAGASQVEVLPEITTKDVWRSWMLATGRISSYEGASEGPDPLWQRWVLRILIRLAAMLGRHDRYHAFITK